MKYLHKEFEMNASDVLQITLDKDAGIKLLDPGNYQKYRAGRDYNCYSGIITQSPSYICAPHAGRWHLVIDLGTHSAGMEAAVNLIRRR